MSIFMLILQYLKSMTFLTALLTGLVWVTLVSCGAMFPQEPQETISSDLSAIKDSFYHLVLAKADLHSNGSFTSYAFYVCHIQGKYVPKDVAGSKYCVNAFADRKGQPLTIPKALVETTVNLKFFRNHINRETEIGKWTERIVFGIPAIILLVPAALSTKSAFHNLLHSSSSWGFEKAFEFIFFATPAVAIGGAYWKFHNAFWQPPKDQGGISEVEEYIDPTIYRKLTEAATSNGQVDYAQLQKALYEYNFNNPTDRWQLVVAGQNRHDVAEYLRSLSLNLNDHETVTLVNTKVPDLLPLLANMLKDVKWFTSEVHWHCLPKRKVEQANPRMCLNLNTKWNTGSFLKYNKPAEFKLPGTLLY
ncbi:MAG: hypothetical protein OXC44_06850 [Proteobacteria bacterium]|nr:hypothetical protein [Pseudomonadota bacterium]